MARASLDGIAYSLFGWAGEAIARMVPTLRSDIVSADMKVYPPAYASRVVFLSIIALVLGFVFDVPIVILLSRMGVGLGGVLATSFSVPLMLAGAVFGLGLVYPKIKLSNRTSRFDLEVPYLSVYITVMATGGISPYTSFERLAKAPKVLFQEIKKEAMYFFLKVKGMGQDPLSAIEDSAKRVPHNGYKQLMLGYAATLRAGGDVVHYLQRQTEVMLRERVSQMKTIGERIGALMESYMAIVLLTSMTLYVLYVVNMALAQAGMGLAGGEIQFVMVSYIIMPMLSGLFIYLADLMQPKYPVYDSTPYVVYLALGIPITIFLFVAMVLPFAVAPPASTVLRSVFSPFVGAVLLLTRLLGLGKGYESGVGMIISLTLGLLPAMIVETRSTLKFSGIQYGLTRFLRDLVEVRKTGMAPEKCIINLKDRDYGKFTPYLRDIAKQVGWGVSLHTIFERFSKGMKNWFALISMFLLVESIEVGGGTPQTLEALASYAETLEQVEKEKRAALRPLMLMPYVGALIITVVVLILVEFMGSMLKFAGTAISTEQLVGMFLPPVIINSYMMGLAAGKIGSERVAAGFKHAILLLLANLVAMMIAPQITAGMMPKL
ncbi:type II secretion system F family protein [Thermofilum pendens]|uniref:Type II secretion system protein n=1 Tax=Thermofilum pendens (strain DSM 2475 / Hrk 5) TaxID=368408 RepID=A1RXC4_THEPD|nr:type II secretion system F family protein [Thermofilum pendens]ABL77854.1 type II secretion system protein [Thermofilum pendens Hrk 5]